MLDKLKILAVDIKGQVTKVEGGNVSLESTVKNVLSVVFSIVGIIAVIMIIIGGVNYMTSQGDTQKIQKAKNTIMYGIIGMVIALLSFAIVQFVMHDL